MVHHVDLLARSSNLTPLEKAVLEKASRIRSLMADGQLTGLEASQQIWAIRDILTAVDPKSLFVEVMRDLENEMLRPRKIMPIKAEQFVTGYGRRVLTDDGQQGMDGKPGIGSTTETQQGHVAAAIFANCSQLDNRQLDEIIEWVRLYKY